MHMYITVPLVLRWCVRVSEREGEGDDVCCALSLPVCVRQRKQAFGSGKYRQLVRGLNLEIAGMVCCSLKMLKLLCVCDLGPMIFRFKKMHFPFHIW